MTDVVRVSPVERPAQTTAHPWWSIGPAALVVVGAVAVDPWGVRSFTSLRWLLVGAGVLAIAATSGLGRVPRLVAGAGAALVGSMVLGAATGLDRTTAWLGHPQRHLGVIAWMVFAVAVGAGARLAADDRGAVRHLLPTGAVCAGVATSAVTVVQAFGWDPAGVTFAGGRLGGLFGQPTTLAAFALVLMPLSVIAPVGRPLRVAVVVGLAATVFATQTRGALVGAAAALVVSAPAWWPPVRARWGTDRPRWVGVVAGVGILAAVAACIVASPIGARLGDVGQSGRVDEWRLATRVIAADPMLGVGPEGYRIAVLDHLDADYVTAHGRAVVIDRAHSAPLDVAASGGVVAGVAYVVLISAVAVATWCLARRSARGANTVALAAGVGATACLGAGLVAFPVPGVDAIAWMLAGLAIAAQARQPRPATPATTGGVAARGGPARAVAAVALVAFVVVGATDVAVDHQFRRADTLAAAGRHGDAIVVVDRATALRPDVVDAWFVAASIAARGPSLLAIDAALDRVEAGLERFPNDPALADLHVELLTNRAIRSDLPQDRRAAAGAIEALAAADPTSLVAIDQRDRLRSAVAADD